MRQRHLLVMLLGLGATACAVVEYRAVYHVGPPSDHFDGTHFFNPARPIGKGVLDVVRWRLTTERAQWPQAVPPAATATPERRVDGAALQATFVGHGTVLLQTAGLNVLVDPIWSERASPLSWAGPKRVTPPGIAFAALPPIDLVLVSHNHYDHMDLPTLAALQDAHAPRFVVPLGNASFVLGAAPAAQVTELDWWQSTAPAAGVRVHVVPVYHWSRRRAFDRNKALWGGFVVETTAGAIYVAGDTGAGDGSFFTQAAERFGGFRLALLPVGAYEPRWFMQDQHVNPAEAVRIHQLLRARTTLGVHLRTFQLTDEAFDRPEIELSAARAAQEVAGDRFLTLGIGQTWREDGEK